MSWTPEQPAPYRGIIANPNETQRWTPDPLPEPSFSIPTTSDELVVPPIQLRTPAADFVFPPIQSRTPDAEIVVPPIQMRRPDDGTDEWWSERDGPIRVPRGELPPDVRGELQDPVRFEQQAMEDEQDDGDPYGGNGRVYGGGGRIELSQDETDFDWPDEPTA